MDTGVITNRPPRDGHMALVRSPDGHSIELLQDGDRLPPRGPWASMENSESWQSLSQPLCAKRKSLRFAALQCRVSPVLISGLEWMRLIQRIDMPAFQRLHCRCLIEPDVFIELLG